MRFTAQGRASYMTPVEFQAKVENGAIIVPEEYRQQLVNGETVKVIVLKQEQTWEDFSQQFHQALVDAGYDSREKIIDLIQEVKREMTEERRQRLAHRQPDVNAN